MYRIKIVKFFLLSSCQLYLVILHFTGRIAFQMVYTLLDEKDFLLKYTLYKIWEIFVWKSECDILFMNNKMFYWPT